MPKRKALPYSAKTCRWHVTAGPRGLKGKTFKTLAAAQKAAKTCARKSKAQTPIRLDKLCGSYPFPVAARRVTKRYFKRAPYTRVSVSKIAL